MVFLKIEYLLKTVLYYCSMRFKKQEIGDHFDIYVNEDLPAGQF